MKTIVVTPVDTGNFLDGSKVTTTEIFPQQVKKKPKRLEFSAMKASLPSSSMATDEPTPDEEPLFASKVIVHTFSSWGDAAHAVNGFYKSLGYSCTGPFGNMMRKGVGSAGKNNKKRKLDTEWLIGKGGKLSIVRKRPKGSD